MNLHLKIQPLQSNQNICINVVETASLTLFWAATAMKRTDVTVFTGQTGGIGKVPGLISNLILNMFIIICGIPLDITLKWIQ